MYKNLKYTCTLVFPPTPQYPSGRRMNRAGAASGYTRDAEELIGQIIHPFGQDVKVENLKLKDDLGKEYVQP